MMITRESSNARPPLVAHIIHRLDVGGLENGLVNLINSMPIECYRHVVVCMAGYTSFANRIRRADVGLFDIAKRPGRDFSCYRRVFQLLRKLRPDIVHTRNVGTIDCQFIAKAAGVPYRIHGEHGWDISDLDGTRTKTVMRRRLSKTVVDRYMTVSRHMATWLKNDIGIPQERIVQIYNGIDSCAFAPGRDLRDRQWRNRPIVVGSVGRLDPIKDHMTLLRAFNKILRLETGSVDWRLVIVGDGEMRNTLEKFVIENDLESIVQFTGASNDVASHLREFDIFVLPSLNEGISNTILEAMATELPVIATTVGGNPELVCDGETGRLVLPGNVDELATALLDYAKDSAKARQHARAARSRVVRKFSTGKMVSEYTLMYDAARFDRKELSATAR